MIEKESEEVREKLEQETDGVLQPYIAESELHRRVINYMGTAEIEGKTARWERLLQKAGITVTKKELDEIYGARSGTTHIKYPKN